MLAIDSVTMYYPKQIILLTQSKRLAVSFRLMSLFAGTEEANS